MSFGHLSDKSSLEKRFFRPSRNPIPAISVSWWAFFVSGGGLSTRLSRIFFSGGDSHVRSS